jgi:hypothetical protein
MESGIKNVRLYSIASLSLNGTHLFQLSHLGFVNAQYRFVMNPEGDYTVHFADPDMYVSQAHPLLRLLTSSLTPASFFQWQDILQIIIPRNSALASAAGSDGRAQEEGHTTCPICLSPPTAPRMTKCGHVSPSP